MKANLTLGEVLTTDPDYPSDKRCRSGHFAEGESPRFFRVSGETLDESRWGVYCLDCIRAAHKLVQERRQSPVGERDVNRRRQ